VDLEVAGADRGLDPIPVATRVRERLRDGGLTRAEEAQLSQLRRPSAGKDAPHRFALERRLPQALQLGRRARQHDHDGVPVLEDEPGRSPGEPERVRAFGDRGLFSDAGLEVRIGPPEPVREAAGDAADLLVQLFVEPEPHSGGARHELDRPVVVRRT